jgi:hypothetical protein
MFSLRMLERHSFMLPEHTDVDYLRRAAIVQALTSVNINAFDRFQSRQVNVAQTVSSLILSNFIAIHAKEEKRDPKDAFLTS